MRKNQIRDGIVVIDHIALGVTLAGVVDLVEIRELKLLAIDRQNGLDLLFR